MLAEIKKLRKELHQYPELSGFEANTAERIREFIETHHNTRIINKIGGNGLAAVYSYSEEGPTIMIRCELDALPIQEENTFDHRSTIKGVSHKCGHDGHIAIVAGLIFWLKEQHFKSGKIVLLFQPAEETGKGAYKVLHDLKFKNLDPDYIFALHNIPKEPLNSIITINNIFTATVQSMAIYLTGIESHASEPENGINPTLGISEIINEFSALNAHDPKSDSFLIVTPIHLNMGQKSYGISPAKGELHYTLRTWTRNSMTKLKKELHRIVTDISHKYQLKFDIEWLEYFPAVENDIFCNDLIKKAAKMNHLEVKERPYPLKFGEDFGWFSQNYKGAMFGLGSGVNTSALHNPDYDFPDEIIETGMTMFKTIIKQLFETVHKDTN